MRAEEQLLTLGPAALEPLLEILKRSEPATVVAIESLLPRFGPQAIETMLRASRASEYKQREAADAALEATARMGPPALPELRKLFDKSEIQRAFAFSVLRRMGPAATDEFVSLLKHPNCKVRWFAASMLDSLANPRTADALLEGARSGDDCVQAETARVLSRLGDRRAVDVFLAMLHSPDWAIRNSGAAALGRLYEPRFLLPLLDVAQHDGSFSVRETAANALERSGDRSAIQLGRRYAPLAKDGSQKDLERFLFTVWLGATGLVIYAFVWIGAGSARVWLRGPLWLSALGMGWLGYFWGHVATKLTKDLEWWLLYVCLPVSGVVCWMAGPRVKWLLVPAIGSILILALMVPAAGLLYFILVGGLLPWLTLATIAFTIIAAFVMLFHQGDRHALWRFRTATILGIATFYSGYALGWWALWGAHRSSLL